MSKKLVKDAILLLQVIAFVCYIGYTYYYRTKHKWLLF